MRQAFQDVKETCVELESRNQQVKAQIAEECEALIALVVKRREVAFSKLDEIVDGKKEHLRNQLVELQSSRETLKQAVDFSRQAFARSSDVDLLLAEPHMAAHLNSYREGSMRLEPIESAFLGLENSMTDRTMDDEFQTKKALDVQQEIASLWTVTADESKALLHFTERSSSQWVHIFDDGCVATQQSRGTWQWAMTNPLPADRPSWFKIKIHTLGHGAIIGLVGGGAIEDRAYSDRTAYGWASSGVKFCGGQRVEKAKEDPVLFREGDEPIFYYDPKTGMLKLFYIYWDTEHLRRVGSRTFTIVVPQEDRPAKGFRVLVNMFWAGDSVELAFPTEEDRAFLESSFAEGQYGEDEEYDDDEEHEEDAEDEEDDEEHEERDDEEEDDGGAGRVQDSETEEDEDGNGETGNFFGERDNDEGNGDGVGGGFFDEEEGDFDPEAGSDRQQANGARKTSKRKRRRNQHKQKNGYGEKGEEDDEVEAGDGEGGGLGEDHPLDVPPLDLPMQTVEGQNADAGQPEANQQRPTRPRTSLFSWNKT